MSLRVANLAGHIVTIDARFLQEHMQAPLVLGKRMAGDLIDEALQTAATIFNKVLIEETVIATERHLTFPRFARQRRNDNLHTTQKYEYNAEIHDETPYTQKQNMGIERVNRMRMNKTPTCFVLLLQVVLTLLSRSSSLRSHSKSL